MEVEVLGSELREARLQKELTLDEVEQELRIRAKFLAAIENGDYSLIPSQVQARGFLRNYAQFLGLNGNTILVRYEQAMGQLEAFSRDHSHLPRPTPVVVARPNANGNRTSKAANPAEQDAPNTGKTSRRARTFSSSMLVFGMAAVFMFFMLALGGTRIVEWLIAADQKAEGVDFIQTVLGDQPTITPSPTLAPTPVSTQGVTIPQQQTFNSVFVIFDVTQRTWARITVDGTVQFEGIAAPGTRLQYQGSTSVAVRAGNAAGLNVVVNDRVVGPLGTRGEVVDLTITLDNVDALFPAQASAIDATAPNTP